MCKFDDAYIGTCKNEPDKDYCMEHVSKTCSVCGKQATHTCPETFSLVCGFALCDDPKCKVRHHPNYHKMRYTEWCDIYNAPVPANVTPSDEIITHDQFKEVTFKAVGILQAIGNDVFNVLRDKHNLAYSFGDTAIVEGSEPYNFLRVKIKIERW